ncbi:fungal-specific transcription factor domain-containing protein [Fomitopsis betulina]|nr:fungal-specific transcription factor domain-containing protein [Fomitopsis betulina]
MPPAEKADKTSGEPKPRRRPGRVPVSCAECRRLKLRCDRKVPCETCVKRGCSAICPEGSLTTGKGNRLALADVEGLHKKIERLRARCTTLEDGLRTLQAAVTDDPHPLLRDDLDTSTESSPSASGAPPPEGPLLTQEDEEFLDAFGTLTLGIRGEARFFGQTARSEYLIHAPSECSATTIAFPRLPSDLIMEAQMELDVPCTNADKFCPVAQRILPSLSNACRLCDIFSEGGKYIWYPLPREELFDKVLGTAYRTVSNATVTCDVSTCHALGLIYMVFALATLIDPDAAPYSVEAQEYYLLSRICLRCAPPLYDTTLFAIQCLIYQGQFLELSDCEPAHTGSQKAWLTIGHAMKLGHSIGLHVNSSRWKLDDDNAQRRARVFWQLYKYDTWMSFGFGRPPSMCTAFVDCPLPDDTEACINADGQKEGGFHVWSWSFAKLVNKVDLAVFGAKVPQYSSILEYDRMIRDFPLPSNLRPNCGQQCGEPTDLPPMLYMQRYLTLLEKEHTLLSLHRPWFAQALQEQPGDLLRHRYGPSVMAIYRSAWRMIEAARESYKRVKVIPSRFGILWSVCLASGIVMCLLVTRAPTSTLAASSLQELDRLVELFEKAASTSQIASNNLEVVRKLRRQGYEVLHKPRGPGESTMNGVIDPELDRLGGRTRLISTSHEPGRSYQLGTGCDMTPGGGGSCAGSTCLAVDPDMIHPTIRQDLRVFEGADASSWLGTASSDTAFNFDMLHQPEQDQAMAIASTDLAQIPVPLQPRPGPDIYDLFGAQAFPPESEQPAGPPIQLDATWQSFIEQLGF